MEGLGLCKRAAMIANADKSRAQAKTKALFLTHEMHRLHRPLREQVRSYKSSRITCRSELVRESAIPDAGNASTAPTSSRTSSLLQKLADNL
ncbi:hypothetical protein ALQ76_102662 [Pseudomonas syringae pv. atrofaciens]|nr:hypothetical protein ALQ76_102662 [Pseudomonas syringae pv. atrofaciens]